MRVPAFIFLITPIRRAPMPGPPTPPGTAPQTRPGERSPPAKLAVSADRTDAWTPSASAARVPTTSRTSTSTCRATPDRDHRPVRLGQVLAGLRHHLCRGPAPLRRVAVGLRAAVPERDGEARRRPHRGPEPGDLDRAEVDLAQPALHRRHDHRDPRLPAPAVRARRHAALPRPRLRRWKRRPSARWSTARWR
jgi:hypothetical protein